MSNTILEEQSIIIQTKDGTTVNYTMRGLKEEEIDTWAVFCASVFSYKENPPSASYFARHYYNDPHRSAELVRVVFFENKIVASCRVFPRTISIGNGQSVSAGGIGEVCTSPNHRRRGLSKVLLQNAIQIMTRQKMELSLLHAAPAFFSVYESSGYACTTSPWSLVQVDPTKIPSTNIGIRQAQFPFDTPQLQALHQQFTETKVAGSIIRSEQYWNEYLSQEFKDQTLWVLTWSSPPNKIVAWLSIRPRGDNNRYQLREFGCDTTILVEGATYACYFRDLLSHALQQQQATKEVFWLQLPTFVLENMTGDADAELTTYIDWTSRREENDLGWMYRPICPSSQALVQKGMPKITEKIPHLVWPSDSF